MERRSPMRSSRRRPRSLSKGRERVPIKYISIEVQDDQRDDVELNVLVNMIQKRQWANVSARLQSQEGINEASRVLPNKDYALHVICKCGMDHKDSKYRHSRGTAPSRANCESSSSNGSGEFSSRANSSITGSTPSSASISITTNTTNAKDASGSPTMESVPPKAILEAIVNAYPEACGLTGEDDVTPLHWAVRHRYPLEMLNVLIRAFPLALDMKDVGTRTPRNFCSIIDDPPSRSALLRPTSCWLQHFQDERKHLQMTREAGILEKEVLALYESLKGAQTAEQSLQQRVLKIEEELSSFGDLKSSNGFTSKAFEIRDEIAGSIDVIRGTLEGLVGQTMMKYADEEKERACLSSFNADAERIYNNAHETMEELSLELEKVTLSLSEG